MDEIMRKMVLQLDILAVYSNRFVYVREIKDRIKTINSLEGEAKVQEAKKLYYYIKSVQNTIVETEEYNLSMYWDAINEIKTLLIDIRKYYRKIEKERSDNRPEIVKKISKLTDMFNSRDCVGGTERAISAYRQFMKTGDVE